MLPSLDRPLGPAFERRVVLLAPGGKHPYEPAEWRDSLVVIEQGEVELEALCGRRFGFRAGAILWLTGLPLRSIACCGDQIAVLVAISRKRPAGSDDVDVTVRIDPDPPTEVKPCL